MIPVIIAGCNCLKMHMMILMAMANINKANWPDDNPQKRMGLFIFRIVFIPK